MAQIFYTTFFSNVVSLNACYKTVEKNLKNITDHLKAIDEAGKMDVKFGGSICMVSEHR